MYLLNEIFNSDDQSFMLELLEKKKKKRTSNFSRRKADGIYLVYVFRFRKLNDGYLKTSMSRIAT